jgi:hypothetical protein
LLVELISLPLDFDITAEGIRKSGNEGRDAVWSMLREAQTAGYMEHVEDRDPAGRILKHGYRVSDDPQALIEATAQEIDALMKKATHGKSVNGDVNAATHGNSESGYPRTAQPCTAQPSTANPQQQINQKGQKNLDSSARAKNSSGLAQSTDEALLLYNDRARRHGWSVCHKLTDARRKRFEKRLAAIGGAESFALAHSAIPDDDFLMGRRPPRDGGRPFRLDLDRLLSTDTNMGDVHARLIDAAMDAQGSGAAHGVEVEVARLAALPMGQSMIREKGRETALAELRELVLSRTEPAHAR